MKGSITRRGFLAASATAAAVHAVAPKQIFAAAPERLPGIQLFMVQADLLRDFPGTLRKLKAIGYPYVEYFALGNHKAAEFKKMIDDAGLQCPTGHFGFGMAETRALLDDAATIGVHYAISSILPPRPMKGSDMGAFMTIINHLERDDFKRMAEAANEIGRQARARGLKYAYHNHNVEFRTFADGETGFSIILKETDPELVHFEADLGWMACGGGDPLAILRSAPTRFPLLHFKDFAELKPPVTTLGTDRQQQIVELGQGLVPFPQIVAEAKKIGVEHYIVDHDPPFKNKTSLDAAKLDFTYLSGLLAS